MHLFWHNNGLATVTVEYAMQKQNHVYTDSQQKQLAMRITIYS
jgi:hypothetical protein